jgi:predicted branched-subunit amino acid permease
VAEEPAAATPPLTRQDARRKLVLDGLGIVVSAVGFGFVYGLAARTDAGFSPIDVMAMSVFAFAGAAQFAAVGYVATGVPWIVIGLLTGLLNARHVLYSASIAPWFRGRPFGERALAAHVLTDEAFALSIAHFRRLGRFDAFGYWFAAIGMVFIPWFFATLAGVLLGEAIVDPERLGIDVIFPAAMIGLAVGLITGRRELVAAIVGAGVGVGVSLAVSTTVGIIAGGVVGPAAGLLVPKARAHETAPIGSEASADRYSMPHTLVDRPEVNPPAGDGPEADR